MTNLPAKNLKDIEQRMLQLPQSPCPVIHRFGPGMYIREVFMPAGTLAMGHTQKFEQMNIFIQGRILMLGEDGEAKDLSAPMTFIGPPGRKIGYVLEDVIWQNVFVTDETDIDKLEEMFLDKTDGPIPQNLLQSDEELSAIRADFFAMLKEFDVSPEQARAESENLNDQIPMPDGWLKTCIRNSVIEGKGVFATCPCQSGEVIAPARIGNWRTPVGRYTNHSPDPNAEMILLDGDVVLVSKKPLSGCLGGGPGEEITVNYRDAIKFRWVKEIKEVEECQQ